MELDALPFFDGRRQTYEIGDLGLFLRHLGLLMPLINQLPNITFFVKDVNARYLLANNNLVVRSGKKQPEELLGKTAAEVFGTDLGDGFTAQDFQVLAKHPLYRHLELHCYQSGRLGWCVATKIPLLLGERIVGMVGMALDLQDDKVNRPNLNSKLSLVEQYISQKFDTSMRISDLAHIAGLSESQLNRQFKAVFHITPQQLIQKKRLELAIDLLRQDYSVTEISARCGYTDHSAFGRKFKQLTSMSPVQFRRQLRKWGG